MDYQELQANQDFSTGMDVSLNIQDVGAGLRNMKTDKELCRAKRWRDTEGEETERVIKGGSLSDGHSLSYLFIKFFPNYLSI